MSGSLSTLSSASTSATSYLLSYADTNKPLSSLSTLAWGIYLCVSFLLDASHLCINFLTPLPLPAPPFHCRHKHPFYHRWSIWSVHLTLFVFGDLHTCNYFTLLSRYKLADVHRWKLRVFSKRRTTIYTQKNDFSTAARALCPGLNKAQNCATNAATSAMANDTPRQLD